MLRGEKPGYFYMRASNPTTRQLELTLARLQGRDDCLATASGVNTIAQTLIALTRHGDHILSFVETYGPTRNIIRRLLARFGVEHTLLSIEDLAGIENVLASRPTRLVMFESPTNPVTKVADIERLVELAHRHGALAVMDNTFAGFHQHGEYDVDLFVHSLTKYASGTGDVMGGAVIGRQELIDGMRQDFSVLGALLDPHAAFLIQRGLKTYFVRYREQTRAAQHIAEHLAAHPAVARVHYPGLPGHPQAALAKQADARRRHGGDLRPQAGREAARSFSERLKLFALTASLGSTESLVMPPQLVGSRDFTAEQVRISGIGPGTVRLSIGLEDIDDLIADIDQALTTSDLIRAPAPPRHHFAFLRADAALGAASRDNPVCPGLLELMSNRTNSAVSHALDAHRAITAELHQRLQELPPSPFDWDSFDPSAALRIGDGSIDLRLVTLSRIAVYRAGAFGGAAHPVERMPRHCRVHAARGATPGCGIPQQRDCRPAASARRHAHDSRHRGNRACLASEAGSGQQGRTVRRTRR